MTFLVGFERGLRRMVTLGPSRTSRLGAIITIQESKKTHFSFKTPRGAFFDSPKKYVFKNWSSVKNQFKLVKILEGFTQIWRRRENYIRLWRNWKIFPKIKDSDFLETFWEIFDSCGCCIIPEALIKTPNVQIIIGYRGRSPPKNLLMVNRNKKF